MEYATNRAERPCQNSHPARTQSITGHATKTMYRTSFTLRHNIFHTREEERRQNTPITYNCTPATTRNQHVANSVRPPCSGDNLVLRRRYDDRRVGAYVVAGAAFSKPEYGLKPCPARGTESIRVPSCHRRTVTADDDSASTGQFGTIA